MRPKSRASSHLLRLGLPTGHDDGGTGAVQAGITFAPWIPVLCATAATALFVGIAKTRASTSPKKTEEPAPGPS
jgi:hypothetical protein